MAKFWTADRIRLSKEILGKHSCFDCALKELKAVFGKDVTYYSFRNALRREDDIISAPAQYLLKNGRCQCENCLLDEVDAVEDLRVGDEHDERIARFEELSKILSRRHKDKRPITFGELCDRFDMSPQKMRAFLDEAKAFGYKISVADNSVSFANISDCVNQEKAVVIPVEKEKISFAVISDTHFGARASRHDALKDFIHYAYDRGIRTVIHAGDITAGIGVYNGQVAELSVWGCDAQCENARNNLPELPGMTYYAITGNHDVDFIKKAGVDIGEMLAASRKDIVYLGALNKRLLIKTSAGTLDIGVAHIKSAAHARSWPVEKHVSRTITKFDQPDMIFCGHRHVNGYFEVQGIHCFMVPCFEDANLFVHYNDFYPSIGGLIVDVCLDEQGRIIRCVPEFKLYPLNQEKEVRTSITY